MKYDTLIHGATIFDGSGAESYQADLGILQGLITLLPEGSRPEANHTVDATGLCLAPGFIDVHTHDDTNVIKSPEMLSKISQGVTTVIVGNCGISANSAKLTGAPPNPMNLLGEQQDFKYPTFTAYADAVQRARPNVNVAALVGHTSLRNNAMNNLFRKATTDEISTMRTQLHQSLLQGALGLSSGLAYDTAFQSEQEELLALVEEVGLQGGIYTTHLRTEFDAILSALDEAFSTAKHGKVPLVVSHLKCAGAGNWGRSGEIISHFEKAATDQDIACDCYPYSASSSNLDINQVTDKSPIFITWSTAHPEQAGKFLIDIAKEWKLSLDDAALKLMPAGAVYHCMDPQDVENVLRYSRTMIGSDGLPNDPHPHPRLWGAFPRVLGYYTRERKIFSLSQAIHKMTGLSANRFKLHKRGLIANGFHADLVLFNQDTVIDTATFEQPKQQAEGIESVWVNGVLSYTDKTSQDGRAGQFLFRQ